MRLQLLLESCITKLEKVNSSNVVEVGFFFLYTSVLLQTYKFEMQEFCFSFLIFCLSVFCALNQLFLPYYLTLDIVRTANHFFTGHFKTILSEPALSEEDTSTNPWVPFPQLWSDQGTLLYHRNHIKPRFKSTEDSCAII